MASGSFDTVYPGIDDFDASYQTGNVNAIYQSYHVMLYMFGVVIIVLLLALLALLGKIKGKWAFRIMLFGWVAALVAIEAGWLVAELGRQPWIVYGLLFTADANSLAVTPAMLVITLVLFLVIYVAIYYFWLRASFRIIKKGPESYLEPDGAGGGASAVHGARAGGEVSAS